MVKVGTSKIRFLHSSTSDCQDLLRRRLVVKVGKSKGSTISHMTAVHPGHWLSGALQKEEEESLILNYFRRPINWKCNLKIKAVTLKYSSVKKTL